MASEIKVYGTDWCGLTYNLRKYLLDARLAYDFHDIERDEEACAGMLEITAGRRRFPLVVVNEEVLDNPSRGELQRVLDDYGLLPVQRRQARERSAEDRNGEARS